MGGRTYSAAEYREAIRYMEGVAIGAVCYVGTANYPEREREALKRVRKAADELISGAPLPSESA